MTDASYDLETLIREIKTELGCGVVPSKNIEEAIRLTYEKLIVGGS